MMKNAQKPPLDEQLDQSVAFKRRVTSWFWFFQGLNILTWAKDIPHGPLICTVTAIVGLIVCLVLFWHTDKQQDRIMKEIIDEQFGRFREMAQRHNGKRGPPTASA